MREDDLDCWESVKPNLKMKLDSEIRHLEAKLSDRLRSSRASRWQQDRGKRVVELHRLRRVLPGASSGR